MGTKNGYYLYQLVSKSDYSWSYYRTIKSCSDYKWVMRGVYTRDKLIRLLHTCNDLNNSIKPAMDYYELPYDYLRFGRSYHNEVYYIERVIGNKVNKINFKSLIRDIEDYHKKFVEYHSKDNPHWKRTKWHNCNNNYEFRHDPVPGVISINHGKYNYGKHPTINSGTLHTVKVNSDPEYPDYLVPKFTKSKIRKCSWDDDCRCRTRNWKYQYKVSHQYMIHLNNHIDTFNPSEEETYSINE